MAGGHGWGGGSGSVCVIVTLGCLPFAQLLALPDLLLSLALIVFHFSFQDKSGSKNLGRFLTSPILEKRNIVLSYTDGDNCGPGRTISSNITLRCKPGRAATAGGMVGGCPLVAATATSFWGSESGKGWWAWVLNSVCASCIPY